MLAAQAARSAGSGLSMRATSVQEGACVQVNQGNAQAKAQAASTAIATAVAKAYVSASSSTNVQGA